MNDGYKLLCLLVKSSPREYFAGGSSANLDFAGALWDAASALGLLENAPQPYLTGKMLLDLGVAPGRQMGEIIKRSFELQLDGKITDIASALDWARANLDA